MWCQSCLHFLLTTLTWQLRWPRPRVRQRSEDGFDLAIHSGDLPDSTLVARRFAQTMIILVATPQYLSRYGAPESPEDLNRFRSVVFVERGSVQPWTFGSG